MKVFQTLTVLVLAFSCFSQSNAQSRKPAAIIPAFDLSSPGKDLEGKEPDYIYKEVVRNSPDGLYTARLIMSDGEVGYLTIYKRQGRTPVWTKKLAASNQIDCVSGCVWVPRQGHQLAFSTSDTYGEAGIGLWSGNRKIRWLRPAGPVDEHFDITGISPDGLTLVYEYQNFNVPYSKASAKKKHYLKLPR
jgi:hypothetical protein